MGFVHLVFGVCVIAAMIFGVIFMASSNAEITSTTDTFGNTYDEQTNATAQVAQTAAQGGSSAMGGLVLIGAILSAVCLPIGIILFKGSPKW